MLFIKYSILILGCLGALAGIIYGLKGFPATWRKCKESDTNGFTLLAFVFSPLSQAVYAWLLWLLISSNAGESGQDQAVNSTSIVSGLVIGLVFILVAIGKSLLGKRACRVISETGKGLNKYLIMNGFIETISIFAFVFGIIALKLK